MKGKVVRPLKLSYANCIHFVLWQEAVVIRCSTFTILHIHHLPVPATMDGRVMYELLAEKIVNRVYYPGTKKSERLWPAPRAGTIWCWIER